MVLLLQNKYHQPLQPLKMKLIFHSLQTFDPILYPVENVGTKKSAKKCIP